MAKKPRLTVVRPTDPNSNEPPTSLGQAGLTLWRSITSEYKIDDAGGLEMLAQICGMADRAIEFAAEIDRDGIMIRGKNGLHEHPLLKHELAARGFVVRSLHKLGLDIEPSRNVMGRPSGTFNKVK